VSDHQNKTLHSEAVRIEWLLAAAGSGEPKCKSFSITGYTGGQMRVGYYGPVVVDCAGVTSAAEEIPVLLDHDSGKIVGHGKPKIYASRIEMTGHVSGVGPAAEEVKATAANGFPWKASVGIDPTKTEYVERGAKASANGKSFEGPVTIVRGGVLREISFVALAADTSTSASVTGQKEGNRSMETTTPTTTTSINRDRLAEIEAACNVEIGSDGGKKKLADLRAQAIVGEITLEAMYKGVNEAIRADQGLSTLRAGRPATPAIHVHGDTPVTPTLLAASLMALVGRAALGVKAYGEQVMERAPRFVHVLDLAKASLHADGRDVPGNRNEMIRAAFSTVSLPGIFSNVAGKIMEQAYQAFPSVARQIARVLTASDFKQATGYRLTGDTKMQEVAPAGGLKHGQLAESSFAYMVKTYGRIFGFTRQDIINDDLGALNEVPAMIGRGAAVTLEELFWKLVLANTSSYFSGGNGNYISGSDTVLGITGLGSAVKIMREQTDTFGTPIVVEPKFLVVPPALEATADALYASTNILMETSTATPDGNPYKGKYQPLVVPHLGNTSVHANASDTAWYLFGNPADVAAFGIAYLNGQEQPTVESKEADFDTLGIQFRGFIDIGVSQVDGKGAVMSKGAQ